MYVGRQPTDLPCVLEVQRVDRLQQSSHNHSLTPTGCKLESSPHRIHHPRRHPGPPSALHVPNLRLASALYSSFPSLEGRAHSEKRASHSASRPGRAIACPGAAEESAPVRFLHADKTYNVRLGGNLHLIHVLCVQKHDDVVLFELVAVCRQRVGELRELLAAHPGLRKARTAPHRNLAMFPVIFRPSVRVR